MLSAAVCLAGCNLDLTPETTLSDTNFWKTETDLRGACNRFYQQMTGELGGFYHDLRSDELTSNSANSISAGSWVVPSTDGAWTDPYWRIFISNNILEKAPGASVTGDVLNKYLAEARFFRAFHYFELVKKYGDVPLIMKAVNTTTDPVLMMPRTPREDIIKQVYEDLDFAAHNLPDIDHVDAWGHVSRSAALAMTVRVGLYEGTYIKYHNLAGDYKSHLKRAIDAAGTMISEGKHALYPDFGRLFTFDGEGRQNKEAVFVKIYGPNGNGTTVHRNSRDMENRVHLTRNMVDLFLYTDGLPKGKSPLEIKNETCFNDVFENRDPRLDYTAFKSGDTDPKPYKGDSYIPFSFSQTYDLKKGFMIDEWNHQNAETVDKMVIRYAEVLISYAEALYEYNGSITDEQLDITVNALRRRAGMPAMFTNAFVQENGLNMLDEIRRERTVEFIDENKRYDDIMRWKTAEKVLPVYILGARVSGNDVPQASIDQMRDKITLDGGMYKGKKVCDQDSIYVLEVAGDRRFDAGKDYLYPVPLQEISLSGNSVTQNPGWK